MTNSPHEHKDMDGRTPLHYAAMEGSLEVVKELVKDDVTRFMGKDKEGFTPLDWAMVKGHTAVVDLLVKKIGKEFGVADYTQRIDALETAVRNGDEVKIRDILSREDDPQMTSVCTGESVPFVALAARHGHTHLLPGLLVAGLSVEGRCSDGETPLMKAAANGHAETVKALLLLGANSGANIKGRIALHYAAVKGHAKCVSILMTNNNHKHKDEDGRTPLHYAAMKGCLEVVKELVKDDVTRFMGKDNKGFTPLDWAMKEDHTAVVDLLVKKIGTELGGADYTQRVDKYQKINSVQPALDCIRCMIGFCNPRQVRSQGALPPPPHTFV